MRTVNRIPDGVAIVGCLLVLLGWHSPWFVLGEIPELITPTSFDRSPDYILIPLVPVIILIFLDAKRVLNVFFSGFAGLIALRSLYLEYINVASYKEPGIGFFLTGIGGSLLVIAAIGMLVMAYQEYNGKEYSIWTSPT